MAGKSTKNEAPRRRRRNTKKASRRKRPGFFTVKTVEKFARGASVANAIGQLAEPVVAAALPLAMAGDMAGALAAAKAGAREAVRSQNLAEAFVPLVAVEAMLMVRRKVAAIARGA